MAIAGAVVSLLLVLALKAGRWPLRGGMAD
jgi:hypothetical protein